MKKQVLTTLLAASVLFSASALYAEHHQEKSAESRVEHKIEKMTKHLDLTPEQQEQIKPIIAEKIEKMKAIQVESQSKIQAILTDEQKAMIAEHKGKKFKQCKDKE
jgi:Spy/CpxP family protein refolding chaperone